MDGLILNPLTKQKIIYLLFLSAMEYHSDAEYNSSRVGVVVVVVVVLDLKK